MSVDIDGYVWVTPRESGLPIMMQYYTKPDKSYKLAKAPPSVAVAVGNNYFFGIDTSSRFWHIDFVNKNLNYQQELPPMVSLDCCQCDLILLDDQGHVWINQSSNSATLIKVEHLPKITSIACGQFHYLALDEDDQVWAWGSNGTGQLGQLDLKPVVDEPTIVPGLPPIKAIQAGRQHSLFLARDVTELWGCGYNNREQIVNKKTDLIIRSPIKIKVDNDNMSMFLRTRTSAIQMKSARKR
jgi:alpha-tubulin suppressor-like RCC1 family protein